MSFQLPLDGLNPPVNLATPLIDYLGARFRDGYTVYEKLEAGLAYPSYRVNLAQFKEMAAVDRNITVATINLVYLYMGGLLGDIRDAFRNEHVPEIWQRL